MQLIYTAISWNARKLYIHVFRVSIATGIPEIAATPCNVRARQNPECLYTASTHVKISQLVTSLQTSRQQDVFALLVQSSQQVVPNLLTTCNKLDENIRLATRLF